MLPRQRTGRTRWVAAAAVLALIGGSLFVASPAQAATSVTDGFEGNPYDRWLTSDTPGDSLVWLGNHRHRRTGDNAAVFDAPFDVPARIYRPIVVEPRPGPTICYAVAYVLKAPGSTDPEVRMLIRAGGPTGAIIHGSTYNLTNTEYGRAQFATFTFRQAAMTIDISVTGGYVFLDDITVWCIREIS